MIPFAELKPQFLAIEEEIRGAIDHVLKSGWFILGEQVAAFEDEFAAYLGGAHAVGCASGTDAIHLALFAHGVGPGDEVITAANTCVPTVCGIAATGATVRLADIDPATCTVTADTLSAALTPRTKAIVPVHLYGHPCDMEPILALARERELIVVEDCAQAHGARYQGRMCGTLGHAAAFSFYPSKNLGAYGDGGAVVTNDDATATRVRMLRNYGEESRYHHTLPGVNSRLDEIQAAILRVKLRHLGAWNEARRQRAKQYAGQLRHVALPIETGWAHHVYHLYVIQSSRRNSLQEHLRDRGIGTLIHYPVPIHLQPAYANLGYARGSFPHAEHACDTVLSLPMYPELPFDSIAVVAGAILEYFE